MIACVVVLLCCWCCIGSLAQFRGVIRDWIVDMLAVHRNHFLVCFDLLCVTVSRVLPNATTTSSTPDSISSGTFASDSSFSAQQPLTRHALYTLVLSYPSIEQIPCLRSLLSTIRSMQPDGLLKLIDDWSTQIDRFLQRITTTAPSDRKRELGVFNEAKTKLIGLRAQIEAFKRQSNTLPPPSPADAKAPKSKSAPKNAADRRDALTATATAAKARSDAVSEQVLKWFQYYIDLQVGPITRLPMHEILFYNDQTPISAAPLVSAAAAAAGSTSSLAPSTNGSAAAAAAAAIAPTTTITASGGQSLWQLFQPQSRAAIQTALGNSSHYLAANITLPVGPPPPVIDALSATREPLHHTLEDVCIAYRLYEGANRLINIYDWFRAFSAIFTTTVRVTTEQDGAEPIVQEREKPLADEKELQTRFITATSTLRALGFIKPYNNSRKVGDCVSKLAFAY